MSANICDFRVGPFVRRFVVVDKGTAMSHAPSWIQHLASPGADPHAPDAPNRSERYTAVVWPFWSSLKADINTAVQEFQRSAGGRRVTIEDAGHKLLLRGDCYGLDVLLIVEREVIQARYTAIFDRPPVRPTRFHLRLDMRPDYLAVLDCRGCEIEDVPRFLLERLFRALVRPYRRPRRQARTV